MIAKPSSKEDLRLPFNRIGDPGWAESLGQLLADYEIPLPAPVSETEIHELHLRLGAPLPSEWTTLLGSFGPLDLEAIRFLAPERIRPATDLWFRQFLTADEQERLSTLLYLAETGSDNFFMFDTAQRGIRLASHDPAGLSEWIPSLTDLLQYACAQLPAGYYGWPDDEVNALVESYCDELLSKWRQSRPDA